MFDKDGKEITHFNSERITMQPGETKTVHISQHVGGLHFWSWGYGYLYTVKTLLKADDGSKIDDVVTRTGFRKTRFAEGKIWLNDRVLMMHGYAQRTSNEWPGVGISVPAWLSDYSNDLMVKSNGNLVRWMHVTPWKQDIESCDRVGLIQAMPAGDAEKDVTGPRWAQRIELMRDAIIYNRNNPSILFYECGNESISREHMLEMKKIRDEYDPYGGRAIGSREMLDIDEAEYGGEMLYINKSKKHPMWAMEYCRDEGLRKYWDEYSYPFHKEGDGPLYRGNPATEYNHNMDNFAVEMVRRWYDYYRERPGTGTRVSSGGVKIVFSDTNTHHRGESNYRTSGVVDAMRLPKDAFYAHQVMWNGWVEPEACQTFIIGHWNYEPGTQKPIYVVSTADEVSEQFGIRTIEYGPQFGMKLNGRKVLLKGYANHHTLGALGAAAYPRAIEKRIQLMKQFGINHIRTSHNPYSRDFIKLCDKYGILVVDELYDKWTQQHTGGRVPFLNHWTQDVTEWIKRDRNSPSVVMWSLGNELQQDPNQPFNDWGVTCYKMMKPVLERYDSTRKVTVAMHPRYRNWETDSLPCDLAMQTDIQAYNYRYMYFSGDGRRFPWMTFYQSEANMTMMGPNWFEMDLSKVIGAAYWGAIDYLGESQGWPAKGWSQGVFDISLEPKPKAYLMKSFMVDEPVVHIAITEKAGEDIMWNGIQTGNASLSENWNRQEDSKVNLIIYNNADEVELRLNGKSLGRRENPRDPKLRNQLRWNDVSYKEGRLEAIAYRQGKPVAHHTLETTSKAVKLIVTPDNSNWKADGEDLQHLRIHAVDSKGRRVLSAADDLRFEVEGDAKIVAVTNGDITSEELNVTNHRRLWKGSAMIILRAGTKPSNVTLKTLSDHYKPIITKLETH